jgi:hypothetical protein
MWPKVAGVHLREHSRPIRLENSILYVAVADAEWKREFKQCASEIVFKLNRSLGRSTVERVEIMIDRKMIDISRASKKAASVESCSLSVAASTGESITEYL